MKIGQFILKNIPWDDPLDPVPLTDIFYGITTHSLSDPPPPEEGIHKFTPRRT